MLENNYPDMAFLTGLILFCVLELFVIIPLGGVQGAFPSDTPNMYKIFKIYIYIQQSYQKGRRSLK